jgi:hypothetical protein
MKRLTSIAAMVLASCSSHGPSKPTPEEVTAAMTNASTRCRQYLVRTDIDPIRNRIPDDVRVASFDQLANSAKATPEEKGPIKVRAEVMLACNSEFRRALTSTGTDPLIVTAQDEYVHSVTSLFAGLLDQELTYGQFLRQWQQAFTVRQKTGLEIEAANRAKLSKSEAASK